MPIQYQLDLETTLINMRLITFTSLLLCPFFGMVTAHPATDVDSAPTIPGDAQVETTTIQAVNSLDVRSPLPENPILAARNKIWTCSPAGAHVSRLFPNHTLTTRH